MRPLSSAPRPLDGPEGPEAFASYVDRVAAGQLIPVPVSTILWKTGLIAGDRHDARLPLGYGIDLTAEQRQSFEAVCRLRPGELQRMLLRDLDGVAFDLMGLDPQQMSSVLAVTRREWTGAGGSACCPACLADTGGWRLRWKLWTSFACLTHARLLVARCPQCQRRTGNYTPAYGNGPRFITHVPVPGRCANSLPRGVSAAGRAARPCGFDLRTMDALDLSAWPRLLATQRAVHRVLNGEGAMVAGEATSPLVYMGYLRSLVALAWHAAQPGDLGLGPLPEVILRVWEETCERRDSLRAGEAGVRGTAFHPYKAAPDDPRLVAALLPWAVDVLASGNQAGVNDAMRPLVERSRVIRGTSVRAMGRDFHLEGPLGMALDAALAPKALTHRTIGHLAAGGTGAYRTFNPAHVPHLIWQEEYERDFRPLLESSKLGEVAARVAVSMALVRLTRPCSVQASATLLGLEGIFRGTSTNPMMIHLGATGKKDAFAAALHDLATRLEGPGPHRDYRAAQRALADFVELDREVWEACRAAAGLRPNRSAALRRNCAAWLWAELLSSDPYFSPALRAHPLKVEAVREVYRRFERLQLPRLRGGLVAERQRMEVSLGLV